MHGRRATGLGDLIPARLVVSATDRYFSGTMDEEQIKRYDAALTHS